MLLADADETSSDDKPQGDVITTSSNQIVSEATNNVSPSHITCKNKVKDNCVGPYAIYQALHRYSNFNTTLNVVAQCFRALALMATGIKDEERRKKILKGFEITRLPAKISQEMSEEEQQKIHITPSIPDIEFAKKLPDHRSSKDSLSRGIPITK